MGLTTNLNWLADFFHQQQHVQGTDIPHLGKRNAIFKSTFLRVYFRFPEGIMVYVYCRSFYAYMDAGSNMFQLYQLIH